jgi:hypothetical protein
MCIRIVAPRAVRRIAVAGRVGATYHKMPPSLETGSTSPAPVDNGKIDEEFRMRATIPFALRNKLWITEKVRKRYAFASRSVNPRIYHRFPRDSR